MIWLPQIPHFMMRESMPSSSECCEECNSTACQAAWTKCNCSPDRRLAACTAASSKSERDTWLVRECQVSSEEVQACRRAQLIKGQGAGAHRHDSTLVVHEACYRAVKR